ncbi:MAG: hypothetical protein FWC50_10140 [Planctomycetaceae bacterium]|nr:hypothetical protein [Planctomycetaceae bacterium]
MLCTSFIRKELDKQLRYLTSDYEIAFIDPLEFSWLDLKFYDTMESELATLGFSKIFDYENLSFSKTFPELRNFVRLMQNHDKSIYAGIMHSRYVKSGNTSEESKNDFFVQIVTEFSDETFLFSFGEKSRALKCKSIDGIDLLYFPLDTPIEKILAEHKKAVQQKCLENGVEVKLLSTQNDIYESTKRAFDLRKIDRLKKGGFTLEEYQAACNNFIAKMYCKQAKRIFREYMLNES